MFITTLSRKEDTDWIGTSVTKRESKEDAIKGLKKTQEKNNI